MLTWSTEVVTVANFTCVKSACQHPECYRFTRITAVPENGCKRPQLRQFFFLGCNDAALSLIEIRSTSVVRELRRVSASGRRNEEEKARTRPPSLLAWMVLLSLCEDSISATQQLRSHRSKQPKWANPPRTAALPSSVCLPPSPFLSLAHPRYFLLTHGSVCWLRFDAWQRWVP